MSTEKPSPSPVSPVVGDEILTTREVAARLGVSDATVKRWADDELLACYKTPGGHRKFRLSDVDRFIQAHHFQVPPSTPALESLEELSAALSQAALAGDGATLVQLVNRARERGAPLATLLDEAVAPVLVAVGEKWACGDMSVAREHVASQAVIDMLGQLSTRAAPATRGVAVVGCIAGERHDVASRMAALVLREAGYQVLHTGADTPLDGFLSLARESGALLVALSMSRVALGAGVRLDGLAPIGEWAAASGAQVLVGGGGFDYVGSLPPHFLVVPNMSALATLAAQDTRLSTGA